MKATIKAKFLITLTLAAFSTLAGEISVAFDVQSNGKTVDRAEVLFFQGNNVLGSFVPVTDNRAKVESNSSQISVEYLIRAPGYAIKSGILPADLSKPVLVNLEKGIVVELDIDGPEPLPKDLLPVIFPEKIIQDVVFSMDARTSHRLLKIVDVEQDESHRGRFHFHSASDDSFRVLVHHPGYLKGFVSNLLKPAEHMELKLPTPGSLEALFRPQHLRDTEKALIVVFQEMKEADAQVRMVYQESKEAVSGIWKDLAPGNYKIEAAEINPSNLTKRTEEIQLIQLAPGSKRTLSLIPAAQQPRFRGDSKLTVRVKNFEGKPLSDALYEFTFFDTNTMATLSVACGKTSDSGEIVLSNFKSGKDAPHFHVKINGVSQSAQFTRDDREQVLELSLQPSPGEFAPHFEVKDLLSGATKTYPNGRYLIIDFWATSCGPCQSPMAHIADVWRRRASEWTNQAEVIAISLDDTKEEVLKRITEKHWEGVSHAWEPGDFSGVTAKKYHVPWLPTSLLIGPNGQVLWCGDPRAIDFEETIDALIAGKLKPDELISTNRDWLDAK